MNSVDPTNPRSTTGTSYTPLSSTPLAQRITGVTNQSFGHSYSASALDSSYYDLRNCTPPPEQDRFPFSHRPPSSESQAARTFLHDMKKPSPKKALPASPPPPSKPLFEMDP
jgi:hypothetical protein